MNYLAIDEVLYLHDYIIEQTGGSHGVRDVGLLESALARPRAAFGGTDFYPDVFTKAAALFESIARNHPFVDGNKRTAIASAVDFLARNGWRLEVTNGQLENYVVDVVVENPGADAIGQWFRDNCIAIGK